MQKLQEYIEENVVNICESSKLPGPKKIKDIYLELFGKEYYNKCGNQSFRKTNHVHELFRGFIGDTEEDALNNVNKFLLRIGLSDDEYNLEYNLRDTEASGQYPSIKITFNKDIKTDIITCDKEYYLFIVNTVGKVKHKELTPAALGVDGEVFKSSDQLKNKLKNTIKKNQFNAVLFNLFDTLTVKDESKKDSLDDILNKDITYENINIGEIDKQTLNIILADYGEVLGGSYLLNTLTGNNHTLFFPPKSNFKNIDYFIDYNSVKNENNESIDASGLSISAKSNGSSTQSSVTMAQTILSQLDSNIINKSDLDVSEEFLKYIIPALANVDKGKNKSAIITCQNKLFNFLSTKDSQSENVMKILEANDLYSKTEEAFKFNKISNMFKDDKEKIYNIISNIYNELKYNPSGKFSIKGGINCNLFDNIDKYRDLYYGCIVYPIRAHIVNCLNDIYSSDISKCCKLGLGYYQLHIDYKDFKNISNDNTCTLVFTLKKLDKEDNWKLEPSGSVNNPKLKAIGCKPI